MKNGANKIPHDFKFIDDEKFGKHPILMYESLERGMAVQFRYLYNGLIKGEHAIYITHEDPQDIKEKMSATIDVEMFQKKGLLHILPIAHNISTSEDAIKKLDEAMKMIDSFNGIAFRLAGGEAGFVKDISTLSGKRTKLLVERKIHDTIDQYNGSILCPYPIKKVNDTNEKKWMNDIFHNHRDVIYVPDSYKGASFDADFML